jgi:hypothetical protein
MATPTPLGGATGFRIGDTPARDAYGVPATPGELQHAAGAGAADLPYVKSEDLQYFGKLLEAEVRRRRVRATICILLSTRLCCWCSMGGDCRHALPTLTPPPTCVFAPCPAAERR